MSYIKTAISIQEPLLQEVNALARQMDIPGSQLFVMAVEAFIQEHHNRQLMEQLNQAYADANFFYDLTFSPISLMPVCCSHKYTPVFKGTALNHLFPLNNATTGD
jgi:metal-responsive CopG/Arc/MetJ family transcriptional regulator